jgi:mannan endo-1,4-beta-mannosidase
MPRRCACLACLLLALTCLAIPAWASGMACPLAWGVALEGMPDARSLELARAQTGIRPRLVSFFLMWPAPGQKGEFPHATLEAIHQAGATPVITWEPMFLDVKGKEQTIPRQQISRGEYDAYLGGFAKACRDWGKPLIMRFAHEMNLARYHWGGEAKDYGPDSPRIYQEMFRYVVRSFKREGAGNVLFVFCPNAESNPHPTWHGADWNRASAYYPGHDYVDVLGMDGYNWGLSQTKAKQGWDSRWQRFEQIFGPLRDELTRLAPGKPLLVFETSSARMGGQRVKWVKEALAVMHKWQVQAVVWFQVKKEVDWRLMPETDAGALRALAAETKCAGPWLPSGYSSSERK